MFIATVDMRRNLGSEEMSHLKTPVTGKSKAALSKFVYSGRFHDASWKTLQR